MVRISGIKSVDFAIKAEGFGVVNWNGSASLFSHQAKDYVSNHLLPKMRNVDMLKVKNFNDITDDAQLYISQNCIKNALFKDFTYGLKEVSLSNVDEVIPSLVGLVRGYVIAEGSTSLKRKSALFIEDFVANAGTKLNYEQFSQSAARNETSIFSKHTVGKVGYTAYGSINIEDLEFIPLEDSLGRSCYREVITEQEGIELATSLTEYLKTLDFNGKLSPEAVFSNNYVRINALRPVGEAGILLNNDAIFLIVEEMLNIIKDLYISRSRAYVEVVELLVDYNTGKPMRIKSNPTDIEKIPEENYAVYYEAKDFSVEEYEQKLKEQNAEKNKAKKEKTKK